MNTSLHTPSISAPALLDLFDALVAQNISLSESTLGVCRDELKDIERRMPATMQTILWGVAKKQGAPDHIGLVVGQQINKEAHGMLSHLITYSSNLREALGLYERFIDAMSEYEKIELQETSWGIRILYKGVYDAESNISAIERSVSGIVTWAKYLTGKDIPLNKVSFKHKRPHYFSEYTKAFGCQTFFDQAETFIDVPDSVLDYEILSANAYLKDILTDHVEKYVGEFSNKDSLSYVVKSMISQRLSLDAGTSSAIASELNMSRQTLHRKLKKHGLNFRTLLEDVRKERSVEYLYDETLNLDEIAERLGFKEPSAFYRAFKSWFNQSPGSFRKKLN